MSEISLNNFLKLHHRGRAVVTIYSKNHVYFEEQLQKDVVSSDSFSKICKCIVSCFCITGGYSDLPVELTIFINDEEDV